MTYAELLSIGTQRLSAAGCQSPSVEAEQLLLHAFSLTRTDLFFTRGDAIADTAEKRKSIEDYWSYVRRREAREPLQHILGTAPMMGLSLHVGPGVFIPRPETELLAEWAICQAQQLQAAKMAAVTSSKKVNADVERPDQPIRIVDLCTGSGALALAIADALHRLAIPVEIIAVEVDELAYSWAERNLAELQERWASQGLELSGEGASQSSPAIGGSLKYTCHEAGLTPPCISLVRGDVTDPQLLADDAFTNWPKSVDICVSNPPYVPESTRVSTEVAADPHHAVFGGDDGLAVIRPMMKLIDQLLRCDGVVGIEHDDDSGEDVATLLNQQWEYGQVTCHPDLAGKDRFTTAKKTE